ncbi:acyl carrier protein, partial [Sansalvadorimonas verongulae]|nr:acyl carrier protein [Sansalvadorimonas verongulae]
MHPLAGVVTSRTGWNRRQFLPPRRRLPARHRLTQRISQELGVDVPVAQLFQQPSVALLASTLTKDLSPIPARHLTTGPLSFAQQRLW